YREKIVKIACIGGGNMVSAIVAGLVGHGMEGSDITVKDPHEDKRAKLEALYGIHTTDTVGAWITEADVLVLGVKPQALKEALKEVAPLIGKDTTVISIAAGVTVEALKNWTGTDRIVRAMPNTPAMVSQGFTGLYAPETATEVDVERAEKVVAAIGQYRKFDHEDDLHTVTGGPGSGVAYVFLFMQGLQEALERQGLESQAAHDLALATVEGAAALARQSGGDFAVLRQNVTSKGGTTAKAIETFEAQDLRGTIDAAVKACIARSKEMSELFK
ncbi:MAG: pyrroline-5-carboxylate reductase, partial [Sutterellaceae bacterium]|nr:pyrroline-5-carboxylate reductase [Sutterellaceae bacterium]